MFANAVIYFPHCYVVVIWQVCSTALPRNMHLCSSVYSSGFWWYFTSLFLFLGLHIKAENYETDLILPKCIITLFTFKFSFQKYFSTNVRKCTEILLTMTRQIVSSTKWISLVTKLVMITFVTVLTCISLIYSRIKSPR